MSIRYCEITIIRNLEEESIFSSVGRFFGMETSLTDNDTIIITFDDETICDVKNEYVDKKYEFSQSVNNNKFPIYFAFGHHRKAFYRNPIIKNNVSTLNTGNLYNNYKKYNEMKYIPSTYNIIYTSGSSEIFGILKLKSNEEKPRYLLAYDETKFDRTDIIYLTNCIFKCKFEKDI